MQARFAFDIEIVGYSFFVSILEWLFLAEWHWELIVAVLPTFIVIAFKA